MRCCREELHTNIVQARQEGEKDGGMAQNREPIDFHYRQMRIIEWKDEAQRRERKGAREREGVNCQSTDRNSC